MNPIITTFPPSPLFPLQVPTLVTSDARAAHLFDRGRLPPARRLLGLAVEGQNKTVAVGSGWRGGTEGGEGRRGRGFLPRGSGAAGLAPTVWRMMGVESSADPLSPTPRGVRLSSGARREKGSGPAYF